MIEENPIALLLDEVLPSRIERGNWQRVLEDASPKRLPLPVRPVVRWRLALVTLSVAVAVAAPLSALAVANDWWFLGATSAPAPTGQVVVVDSGSWNSVPWTLTSYRSQTGALCVAFTPNSPNGRPTATAGGHTAAMGCTSDLRGLPNATPTGPATHSISFISSSSQSSTPSAFPDFAAGATAQDITQVKIVLADGKQLVVDTLAAPGDLGAAVRFYVAPVPAGDAVQTVVALDESGNAVDQFTIPNAPTIQPSTGPTPENSTTGGVQWGG